MSEKILNELLAMSRTLGDPGFDYAILGEGNTSARIDDESFYVKASGTALGTLQATDLVQVSFERVFDLFANQTMTDAEINAGLKSVKLAAETAAMPSVETFLHAVLYRLIGINFIGHTHPTAINAILCSQHAAEAYSGSLFPDQIVYCGPAPVYVPYTDPGLPLAHAVWEATQSYCETWGEGPKTIMMQNHGFIALGHSANEVENITQMSVKAARVIAGTYSMGGPHFLSSDSLNRIHTRPDEHYRKSLWGTR
jgi:rhamnose utilization protein RhaD (predicted bifunctional aldolase and dehydrogenase)